jgi:hypothetical protein
MIMEMHDIIMHRAGRVTMSTISIPPTDTHVAERRKLRLLAVAGAALATFAVWLLADKVLGVDLRQPAFGSMAPQPLGAGFVATVGAGAALLGWALLALFERLSTRGGWLWLLTSLAALVLSLGGPLSGDGVSSADRLALVCMHLAAGAVVIPLLYRGSPTRLSHADHREAG